MKMQPLLFNTDMVRAILDNRKTVTRRVVKGYALDHLELDTDDSIIGVYNQDEGCVLPIMDYAPYRPGDILYVPQPWKCYAIWDVMGYEVEFQDGEYAKFEFTDPKRAQKWAKYLDKPPHQWQSPYFMPREAARIFLRVIDVRVEGLQAISHEDAEQEGCWCGEGGLAMPIDKFADAWDSTIKPADLALYGWDANPWVWVIEFERCEKPEEG